MNSTFDHAECVHERILRAGPPEPELFTTTYRAQVFAEGPYTSSAEVLSWLRTQLGNAATITAVDDEETIRFDIDDTIDDITDEDDAQEAVAALITGGPHDMTFDHIDIDDPTEDDLDWDAILKDRRLEQDWA